jgi:hypothetical protein
LRDSTRTAFGPPCSRIEAGIDRITRTAEGLRLRLEQSELTLLRRLPDELRLLYESGEGPVRERLFPRAYLDPTEEESEREWEALVHPDLVAQRLGRVAEFEGTVERFDTSASNPEAVLADDEVEAWLGLLNDARLALGTRLGVDEETELDAVPPEHPDAVVYATYGWLTSLQGELVEALLE